MITIRTDMEKVRKTCINNDWYTRGNKEEYSHLLNDMCDWDIEQKEAFSVAINALEKQIPKKPEYEGDGYADGELVYDYAKCPICGHDFEYGINDWGCEYCSDCGQKLDWGDEE